MAAAAAAPIQQHVTSRVCLQALSPEEKGRLGFERELLKYIDKLMLELKTKVRRNEDRLVKENVPVIEINDQVCAPSHSSGYFKYAQN